MSQTLLDMGFPAHIVALIQSLYSSQQASVQVAGELTEKFDVKRGARQGCILSPALFNTYSEQIMRNAMADNQTGTSIGGRKISDLRYADDVAILAESKEGLQSILQKISNESKLFDLHMNLKKTKVMVCSKNPERIDIQLDGENVEQVEDFVYLGASCSESLDNTNESRASVV